GDERAVGGEPGEEAGEGPLAPRARGGGGACGKEGSGQVVGGEDAVGAPFLLEDEVVAWVRAGGQDVRLGAALLDPLRLQRLGEEDAEERQDADDPTDARLR